jgi:hypothetical protein
VAGGGEAEGEDLIILLMHFGKVIERFEGASENAKQCIMNLVIISFVCYD